MRTHSTYELIEKGLSVRIATARQRILAEPAGAELASLLCVERGIPIVTIDRLTFDANGTPVEWGVISYPHHEVECEMELVRESDNRRETPTGFALRYLRAPTRRSS